MSQQYRLRRLAREYPLHALAGPAIDAAAALDSRDAEIARLTKIQCRDPLIYEDDLPDERLWCRAHQSFVEAFRRTEIAEARIAVLETALREIRDQNPIDAALDPDWAIRQARAVLTGDP